MAHRRRDTDLPWAILRECIILVVCLVAMYVAMIALLVAQPPTT